MSNDVQSHDTVGERAAADRRTSGRHAAAKLGAVQARLIGGSPVDLVNFSNRGVLFECDSRLLIGARASVRITSSEHNLVVTGRVVRSRVKGLVNGALRYDAALALDHEFALTPALVELMARAGAVSDDDFDVAPDREPVDEYLAESEASLAEAVRDRTAADPADAPPPIPEAAVAEDEPVAFEADAEIAFEPAVEFTIEPAAELAFEIADDVAFEPEPAAETMDVVEAIEPTPAEPPAAAFFDATPQAPAHPGVSMFDPTPAPETGVDQYEQTPAADAEVAFEASAAFEAPVAFEAEGVHFEAAVEPAAAIEPAPAIEPAAAAAAASAEVEPAAEIAPEPPSEVPPPLPVVEDRVMQQFAATVPDDLADLRRIAADNQW